MTDTTNDGDLDLLAVLPRFSQLGTALNASRLIERATENAGLRLDRPALGVLVALRTGGEPLRVGEIAKRMQVVGPHVTRQVNELERRNLVQRVADPDDKRARLVALTPDGEEAVGRYLQTVLGVLGEALAGWSPEDRRTFGRLLDRFATDLTSRLSTLDS
ncbi:MarR family winged helix-turn-helix transcriptional regulator [Actinoplanes couchii]|uniref:MarR family transcriptional regulator n=1 Tax=Actinoplanes couchii TaxID=403638 RepID=A0ABQ3XKJ9_9ACTN|nr:MarR family transcriptional regulator [Actinoplanes couchii]MDR6319582.1 DNA-binding MarR family transcriptional regulator [Actinoplanes couchii]GID59027.1 MarR family transcriptional regulator [Actinoplanes couchii]